MKSSNQEKKSDIQKVATMTHGNLNLTTNVLETVNRHEQAKINLMRACTDYVESDLDLLYPREIDTITEYIKFGFDFKTASSYAVNYGENGLSLIEDLGRHFILKSK